MLCTVGTTLRCRTGQSLRTCARPLPSRTFFYTRSFSLPRISRFPQGKNPLNIPSFGDQIARSAEVKPFSERMKRPPIIRQVLFVTIGSFLAFTMAASATQSDTEWWAKKLTTMTNVWMSRSPTSEDMKRAQYVELGRKLQDRLGQLKERVSKWPVALRGVILGAYVAQAQSYLDAVEGARICWLIGAFNFGVYLLWKIPRLQPIMTSTFMHHPLSGLSYTLLTSVFSHKSFLHLLANTLALGSFGSVASLFLARIHDKIAPGLPESTTKYHLLAFFVSAGLFSGLCSHVVAAKYNFPRILSQLSSTSVVTNGAASIPTVRQARKILPSLGSSGAIYALLTFSALAFPEGQVTLIFPPLVSVPIQTGAFMAVTIDIIGLIRGWRMFDHWAHLGGAAFGVWYYYNGPGWWAALRETASEVARE